MSDSGRCGLLTSFDTDSATNCSDGTITIPWQPVRPPKRGAHESVRSDFYAYMLLPLTIAFHAATLGRSRTSIATYRARAQQASLNNPAVQEMINAQLRALRPEHGMQMARRRGRAQLPHWSILAIAEYRDRGFSRRELAVMFRCSPGTIANALQWKNQAYDALSGERRLSAVQRSPPGKWKSPK